MNKNKCPVCGMATADSEITARQHGLTYHLCSVQCQENFTSHPEFYLGVDAKDHQRKRVIKKRSFTLDVLLAETEQQKTEQALLHMMGVQTAHVSRSKISVTYNLLEATAMQIEQLLEQEGVKQGAGWAARLKCAWVHYTEETELDNLDDTGAACCNRPPPRM